MGGIPTLVYPTYPPWAIPTLVYTSLYTPFVGTRDVPSSCMYRSWSRMYTGWVDGYALLAEG